jgi:hypothetical protein
MKANKAIIVESPFQLLCAYEAWSRESGKIDIYIRRSGNPVNDVQLANMAEDLFPQVEFFNFHVGKRLNISVSIAYFFKRVLSRQYERVFFGSCHSGLFRALTRVAILSGCHVVYLDDGMATLLPIDNSIKKKYYNSVSFFTFFNLKKELGVGCLTHSFDNLREKVDPKLRSEYVIFLGQPLVDRGYVELEVYRRCVEDVSFRHPELSIYYIPHRAESDHLIKNIADIGNVEILVANSCIEWFLIKNKEYPSYAYGFTSTALVTLPKIFEGMSAFCFDLSYKNYPRPQHISNILAYFRDEAGVVVERPKD